MSAYEMLDVTATREGRVVVDVPRLSIARGQVVAITGPNGAGKTTILDVMGFLVPPGNGLLRFFGEPVSPSHLHTLRRRVGYLLQNPYLFDTSVLGNVEWGLKIRGIRGQKLQRRVVAALERAGLANLTRRSARRLSGGEVQRVALARLLALSPEVILLDEPTVYLDAESAQTIERVVREEQRERNTTVVMATHDVAQAYRLGASLWKIADGVLRQGQPENVFRGRPDPGEPDVFETGRLRLTVHPLPQDATCVAVSPDEVLLSRDPLSSSARNRLKGVVTKAEMVNVDDVRVTLECGELLVALITRKSWEELGLTVGQPAVASFKATAVRAY